jgi:hypothetical protein
MRGFTASASLSPQDPRGVVRGGLTAGAMPAPRNEISAFDAANSDGRVGWSAEKHLSRVGTGSASRGRRGPDYLLAFNDRVASVSREISATNLAGVDTFTVAAGVWVEALVAGAVLVVGVGVVLRRVSLRRVAARGRARRPLVAGARRATMRSARAAASARTRRPGRRAGTARASGGDGPRGIHGAGVGRRQRARRAAVRPPARRRPYVVRSRKRTPLRWRSCVTPGTERLSATARDRRAVARSSG